MAITRFCNADEPGAVKLGDKDIYINSYAEGLVLDTWERNGYDDSDFMASYSGQGKSEQGQVYWPS